MAAVSNNKNIKSQKKNKIAVKSKSRAFPVLAAGAFCAVIAVLLGYGSWFFFSTKAKGEENRQQFASKITGIFAKETTEVKNTEVEASLPATPEPAYSPEPSATPDIIVETVATPEISQTENKEETSEQKSPIIEGVVFVKGSIVNTGGGKTEKPIKRTAVDDFYIAETEVTNKQYAEFINETKRKPPSGWVKNQFPKGTDDFPVTNLSYSDAESFCKWLSKKINEEVRLPNEAEWEHAAKGAEELLYPWGAEWDNDAVVLKGKVRKVKSSERNKSPFGAYDMAGNVWEMTSDVELNSKQKPAFLNGELQRIVRGGSAAEATKEDFVTTRWYSFPDSVVKNKVIGFRYVVVKSK